MGTEGKWDVAYFPGENTIFLPRRGGALIFGCDMGIDRKFSLIMVKDKCIPLYLITGKFGIQFHVYLCSNLEFLKGPPYKASAR